MRVREKENGNKGVRSNLKLVEGKNGLLSVLCHRLVTVWLVDSCCIRKVFAEGTTAEPAHTETESPDLKARSRRLRGPFSSSTPRPSPLRSLDTNSENVARVPRPAVATCPTGRRLHRLWRTFDLALFGLLRRLKH